MLDALDSLICRNRLYSIKSRRCAPAGGACPRSAAGRAADRYLFALNAPVYRPDTRYWSRK